MTQTEKDSLARTLAFFAVFALGSLFAFVFVMAPRPVNIEKGHTFDMTKVPDNTPVWTKAIAKDFPGCRNIENRPANVIPNRIVAVNLKGNLKDYSFDNAMRLAHNHQIFVVGYCE